MPVTEHPHSKLIKSPISLNLARAYLYQLLRSEVWFSDALRGAYAELDIPLEKLTMEELQQHFFSLDPSGMPEYLYYFKPTDRTLEGCKTEEFPEMFTDIKEMSYDMGLLVLSLYGQQHYVLYGFSGELLHGPCHDLNLLANGKFISRFLPDIEPQGFCLYQIDEKKEHLDGFEITLIKNYGDMPSEPIFDSYFAREEDTILTHNDDINPEELPF